MKTIQQINVLLETKESELIKLRLNYGKPGNKGYRTPFLTTEVALLKWVLE